MPKKTGKGLSFQDQVLAEAQKQGVEVAPVEPEGVEEEQQTLPGIEPPPPPPPVMGSLMLAEYVLPHFSNENGVRNCGFQFDFPLTKAHRGKLPKPVEDAWKHVEKHTSKGVVGIDLPEQTIFVRLVPDVEEPDLILNAATMKNAQVKMMKQPGSEEKIPHFNFQAVVAATEAAYTFAATHFGDMCWIEIHQAQGTLEV